MSAPGDPPGGPVDDATPRRLHPATMLVALIRGAPSTLLGVPALLAVVARADLWLILAGAGAAFLVAGLLRWAAWHRFTYALTADAVVIESGIVGRHRRIIPYGRVADVGIERRPLQRLFGLASVTLETGGAGADEGALDSVSVAEAERLRGALRHRLDVAGHRPAVADAGEPTPAAVQPIFAMDTRRVLLWGLFNFSLIWIAVGFGALQYVDRALGLEDDLLWDAIAARTGRVRSLSGPALAGAVAAAVAVVLAVGVVAGLVRTALRDHGFRLLDEVLGQSYPAPA